MVLTNYIPLFPMPSSQACCFQSIAKNHCQKLRLSFTSNRRQTLIFFESDGQKWIVTWPHERAGIHSMGSYIFFSKKIVINRPTSCHGTWARRGHSIVKLRTMCEQKKSIFSKLHHQNGSKFYQFLFMSRYTWYLLHSKNW